MSKRRRLLGGGVALALAGAVTAWGPSAGAVPATGWLTAEAPYLSLAPGLPAGAAVKAIISSGEGPGGFVFEGIPDGIGLRPGPVRNTVDVYVNHEQSTVPFQGARDVFDSSVSRLTLETRAGARQGSVLGASVAIDAALGFLRFCSAFMGGPAEGLDDYVFFTGEETNDIVPVPAAAAGLYGPDAGLAPNRQGGYQVVLNTDSGELAVVLGMGRINHENTVVVPGGWDSLAMLTTDDTFSPPSSQLYLYLADDQDAIFDDTGTLYAFRVTGKNGVAVNPADPFNGANDYLDVGVDDEVTGEFIAVPPAVARGPQAGLEAWSNANNVFQAIRLEDLAYDKNDPRVVYIADTGATRVVPNATSGRLVRGPSGTVGQADNGRVFKLVMNADDPTVVDSLTVLADGDAVGHPSYVPFTSPDNVDTSKKSLMVQEDTNGAQIFQYRFNQASWRSVATVNDPVGESSGIVDASEWFGQGTWLVTVQGHGRNVLQVPGSPIVKRESGQLLLLTIPAS
jgi:hypothetical protein